MKVLLAPAEFYFNANNYHVSYNILRRINIKFYVFTNKISKEADQKLQPTIINELETSYILYPIQTYIKGRTIAKNVDLIHHLAPFAIEKDFNLLALSTSKPFIIGPIEIPHRFFDDELGIRKIPILAKLIRNSRLRRYLSVKTLERCDVAIAVNGETRDYLSRFVDESKIRVIPFGVDLDQFEYTQPPENYDILAVGIHIKRKGFDYLIEAMPQVLEEYPTARLHIASDGPQTPDLKRLARDLGLEDSVIFHGRVSDEELLRLYERCRVFCHPSLSEAFSPVRLEAMASGVPLVATTAASGASEMIEDGVTGFLIPPGDSDAITEGILKLFDDYDLTCRMARKAREKAEEYDWDIVAEKYHDVYREVLE